MTTKTKQPDFIKITRYSYKPKPGRKFTKPSLTEPGQGIDIETVVRKHNAGVQPVEDWRLEWIDTETKMPKLLDLTDIDEQKMFIDSMRERLAKVQAELLQKAEEKDDKKETPEPQKEG